MSVKGTQLSKCPKTQDMVFILHISLLLISTYQWLSPLLLHSSSCSIYQLLSILHFSLWFLPLHLNWSLCPQSYSPWSQSVYSQMLSFHAETLHGSPSIVPMLKSKSLNMAFKIFFCLKKPHCVFLQPFCHLSILTIQKSKKSQCTLVLWLCLPFFICFHGFLFSICTSCGFGKHFACLAQNEKSNTSTWNMYLFSFFSSSNYKLYSPSKSI